jgi:hypothetical protein
MSDDEELDEIDRIIKSIEKKIDIYFDDLDEDGVDYIYKSTEKQGEYYYLEILLSTTNEDLIRAYTKIFAKPMNLSKTFKFIGLIKPSQKNGVTYYPFIFKGSAKIDTNDDYIKLLDTFLGKDADSKKAEDIRQIKQTMMDKFGVKSLRPLGEGGEGEVFKIGDFVVKIIPFISGKYKENTFHRAQFVKEMEFWNRFFPKKSMLSRIRNAITCKRRGICGQKPLTLIDFLPKYVESMVWHESTTFTYGVIVFQYEDVMDMHNYIHTYSKRIAYKKGTEIFNNLVKGFQLLHDAGYAHVDIKPANILIRDSSNIPIIIDFGFMCKLEECGTQIGTYSYIPKVMRPYFIDPDDWLEEGNSREKKNPLKLKMGANTDKYSLALTLGQWMTNINWSGGPPGEKERYSTRIRELQAPLRRRIKNTRRIKSRANE